MVALHSQDQVLNTIIYPIHLSDLRPVIYDDRISVTHNNFVPKVIDIFILIHEHHLKKTFCIPRLHHITYSMDVIVDQQQVN